MLSKGEINALRQKILEYRPVFENNIGGQCLLKALELYNLHSGGLLYWVGSLSKLNLEFGIHHTYFFPPGSRDSDSALNLSDNGFPQYPPLTKKEAAWIGDQQDVLLVRQLVTKSIRNL